MNKFFVGIDTSNYTTSAALCDGGGEVLANIKAPLPVAEGGRGLRQSDAVFAHIKNLPEVMSKLGPFLEGGQVAAVGVSAKPRDAEGSYMPCFLSGVAAASAFAVACGVPLYEFSHQSGHIMAAAYSSGGLEELMQRDFCAFHVSGGTTETVKVSPRECGFDVELIGGSADLCAGQAIDRVGVMMGLRFPCGPELEVLARQNIRPLPKPKISVRGLECNLSGLENMAAKLYSETEDKAYVAAYTLNFIGETLRALRRGITERYGNIPTLFGGGVMSNEIIKDKIGRGKGNFYSEPAFSADNAAGISLLCRQKHLAGE